MALGKRKPVQQPLFVSTDSLAARPHPFYQSLNKVLAAHHFDTFAEGLCAKFYDDGKQGGRPGLPPGVYFRCLMVGYFEGKGQGGALPHRLRARHRLAVQRQPLAQAVPGRCR